MFYDINFFLWINEPILLITIMCVVRVLDVKSRMFNDFYK